MYQPNAAIFTATPKGILMSGVPLSKFAARNLAPVTLRYIERAEALLKTVTKNDWGNRTPHTQHNIPTLANARQWENICRP